MFSPFIAAVEKSKAAEIGVAIVDGSGIPLTGLVNTDVRVTYLKQDGSAMVGKTLLAAEFEDAGNGIYNIHFLASDLDTSGYFVISVTPDPGYVGTMRQSVTLASVADGPGLPGGFLRDRASWVPLHLSLASIAVGGLVYTDIDEAQTKKQGGSYTALTLTASNFREILDGVDPTGIYQFLLPETFLADVETFQLRADDTTFDETVVSYHVVEGLNRPVYVTVLDGTTPLVGATVYGVKTSTGLVVDTQTTDALGQCILNLPDGDYRLTLAQGSAVFDENNTAIMVKNPTLELNPAEEAMLTSGSQGPFNVPGGANLQIQVNSGEVQEIVFSTGGVMSASEIAERLDLELHSFKALPSGINNTQILLSTLLAGSDKTIQVIGGTLNAVLNFPTTLVTGKDEERQSNRITLKGSSFTPGFPAAATDLVEMTFRVVDLEGNPTEDVEVLISNHFSPIARASDGSAILGRKVLHFFTDGDGILQSAARGKPKLIKGAIVDVLIKGTDIIKQNITVPQTNFDLTDLALSAEDIFTIQQINLPRAPRSSP